MEPLPTEFHVVGTSPPMILWGFNFSERRLTSGETVTLVLDMFQRWVYSERATSPGPVMVASQLGRIEEPVLSSPYRKSIPEIYERR